MDQVNDGKLYCKSGGCTAKLGAGLLSHVLERLPKGPKDPDLLVGYDGHDDAAVYRIREDLAIVQTLDFFPPMVEDPYLFGQIAATNALSDIYAMGGEVKTALNIVCFPESMDLNILGRILEGGQKKVLEAGGSLVGGHSIDDAGVKYGLAVTGFVNPKKMWTNDGAKEGDVLIFTKRLGTGILTAGRNVGETTDAQLSACLRQMTTLNRGAAEAASGFEIHAATDVTGFGFLGHLTEMLGILPHAGSRLKLSDAGDLSCVIYREEIPLLPGALSLASNCVMTGGGQKNRNYCGDLVDFAPSVTFGMQEVLFDPQTAGGLLFAVAEKDANALWANLTSLGIPAAMVGKITGKGGNGSALPVVVC